MALPETGISVSLVSSTLGIATGSVITLCSSDRVNKWSKRKPFSDSRISIDSWARSDKSPNIRWGLFIPNHVSNASSDPWLWASPGPLDPHRLGDFRGYEPSADMGYFSLSFPNELYNSTDYEVILLFNAYSQPNAVALHDIFDLENKYCCLMLEITGSNGSPLLKKQSERIFKASEGAPIYGVQVMATGAELSSIITKGGTIELEVYMVEADDYFQATGFVNPVYYSLKVLSDTVVYQKNNQYQMTGFVINSNFNTQWPNLSGTVVNSTTFEQISVSSMGRTGGNFSGYFFRARILNGNQIGSDYVYAFPTQFLNANQSFIFNIPSFSLNALDANQAIEVEYSVWNGIPGASDTILSHTYKLS